MPELRNQFTFEAREKYYSYVCPKAYAVVVGHGYSKKQLQQFYNIDKEKIFIIPFSASSEIRKQKTNKETPKIFEGLSSKKYLFYPAQYWPHKNHRYLIDVIFNLVNLYDKNFKIVFTGSDKGNKNYLIDYVKSIGLSNNVIFYNFITDKEIYSLYCHSAGLIMPSLIGPGTLPTIEALELNIPVLVKDNIENYEFYGPNMNYDTFENPKSTAKTVFNWSIGKISPNLIEKKNKSILKTIKSTSEEVAFFKRIELFHQYIKLYKTI